MASMPPPQDFRSNYPRGPQAIGYVRPPGVYFDTIGTAFEMIRADLGVYATCSLICMAISYGVTIGLQFAIGMFSVFGVSQMPNPATGFGGIFTAGYIVSQVIGNLVSFFMFFSLTGVGVRHALGHWPSIPDLFLTFRRFGRTLGAVAILVIPLPIMLALLSEMMSMMAPRGPQQFAALAPDPTVLMVYVGIFIVFCVAYLFLMGPMYLGAAAAAFTDLPILEAYGQAFKRTGAGGILLSLVFLIALLASSLGAILCCVGLVLTFAIGPIVVGLHYIYYFPPVQLTPAAAPQGYGTPTPQGYASPAAPTYETPAAPRVETPAATPTPEPSAETPSPDPEPPVEPPSDGAGPVG